MFAVVNAWEVLNRPGSHHGRSMYLRASSRSYSGREIPRRGPVASAERLVAGQEVMNESRPDLQPGDAQWLRPGGHDDRDRRLERRISPRAHSPTRRRTDTAGDRAHELVHEMGTYTIKDSTNDTTIRDNDPYPYPESSYRSWHISRPQIDDDAVHRAQGLVHDKDNI